jgi:hypothetical protein
LCAGGAARFVGANRQFVVALPSLIASRFRHRAAVTRIHRIDNSEPALEHEMALDRILFGAAFVTIIVTAIGAFIEGATPAPAHHASAGQSVAATPLHERVVVGQRNAERI